MIKRATGAGLDGETIVVGFADGTSIRFSPDDEGLGRLCVEVKANGRDPGRLTDTDQLIGLRFDQNLLDLT